MQKGRGKTVPVFSVVVPVYNAERYLNKALQSILLAAEILATETAAIRTNFAAESVSQILAK